MAKRASATVAMGMRFAWDRDTGLKTWRSALALLGVGAWAIVITLDG